MGYDRKRFDNKKLKKLIAERANWFGGGYYDEKTGHYVRIWKSNGKRSFWAYAKKLARKRIRLYLKKYDVYTKKADDLWWNVW